MKPPLSRTLMFLLGWSLTGCILISDDVKNLIYSRHKRYCSQDFCSKDLNYEIPYCSARALDTDPITAPEGTGDSNMTLGPVTPSGLDPRDNESTIHPLVPRQQCTACEPCSCDDACVIYGDCCPDKHIGGEYFFECEDILTFKNGESSIQRYDIVTKCLPDAPNYSPDLAEKCENGKIGHLQDGRLVMSPHPFNTNVTFRNKHCAICYNVNFTSWDLYIECLGNFDTSNYSDVNALIRETTKTGFCFVGYASLEPREPKRCDDKSISTCNVTGEWIEYNSTIEEACQSYYIRNRDGQYRNIFCYLCNGQSESELQCPTSCELQKFLPVIVMPFGALVNFDNSDMEIVKSDVPIDDYKVKRIGEQAQIQCRDGDIYDEESKKCREVYCSLSGNDDNSTCINVTSEGQLVLIPLWVKVYYETQIFFPPMFPLIPFHTHAIEMSISRKLKDIGLIMYEASASFFAKIRSLESLEVTFVYLECNLTFSPGTDLESALQKLQNMSEFRLNTTALNRDVVQVAVVPLLNPAQVTNMIKYRLSGSGSGEPWMDLSKEPVLIPSSFNVSCPLVRFDSDEVFRENDSIIIHETNKLEKDEYFIYKPKYVTKERYFMCVDSAIKRHPEITEIHQEPIGVEPSSNFFAQQIVTGLCLSVSLVCLLLTIIVYLLLKDLHTVPGINLILLASSLFAAQAMYLFGSGTVATPTICTVIGVCIHFFWLVAFAWMNVCCIHMFRVFNHVLTSLGFTTNKTKLIVKYCILSYGIPLLIVTTTVVVTYIQSDYTHIGYGGDKLCFVRSGLVSIISFGVPAGITVLLNAALLTYTIIRLRKEDQRRRELNQKGSNGVGRFFKLSTITGLSWMFGLLGFFLDRIELIYTFTVLSAGQGIFIFFSFVVSKRILKLLMNLFRQKKHISVKGSLSFSGSGQYTIPTDTKL